MISSPLGRCIIHRGLSVTRLLTLDSPSNAKKNYNRRFLVKREINLFWLQLEGGLCVKMKDTLHFDQEGSAFLALLKGDFLKQKKLTL